MLEKSLGLLYYLKQTQNQKNENRYIYLRITVDGERREISTKRQCIPDQWNAQLGRTTGVSEEAKELNSYLDLISVYHFFNADAQLSWPQTNDIYTY
jgi:hypothetical protein